MTYDQRLPYADSETPHEMAVDAHEVGDHLHIDPTGDEVREVVVADHLGEVPATAAERLHSHYEVSDDLARVADGLELHFD
jgi:hypothetical protein